MSDHLPECWFHDPAKTPSVAVNDGWPCICDRLRACEQRVWKVAYNQGLGAGSDMHGQHEKGWIKGYDAGVAAARDAVPHDEGCLSNDADADERDCNCWRPSALAAIEVLIDGSE